MTIFKDKIVTARKEHRCNGISFIQEEMDNTMPPHTCNHIRVGDKYHHQVHNEEGDFCDFKTCLPCEEYARANDIAFNHD